MVVGSWGSPAVGHGRGGIWMVCSSSPMCHMQSGRLWGQSPLGECRVFVAPLLLHVIVWSPVVYMGLACPTGSLIWLDVDPGLGSVALGTCVGGGLSWLWCLGILVLCALFSTTSTKPTTTTSTTTTSTTVSQDQSSQDVARLDHGSSLGTPTGPNRVVVRVVLWAVVGVVVHGGHHHSLVVVLVHNVDGSLDLGGQCHGLDGNLYLGGQQQSIPLPFVVGANASFPLIPIRAWQQQQQQELPKGTKEQPPIGWIETSIDLSHASELWSNVCSSHDPTTTTKERAMTSIVWRDQMDPCRPCRRRRTSILWA